MTLPVTGSGYIALRVTDLDRAKRFYTEALGFTLVGWNERACFVAAGGTDATPPSDRFDPFRVGFDHLALSVPREALPALRQQLNAANVRNNGIAPDTRSSAESITFYDPDGTAWEVYARG